jgi:hypothetical protein
MTTNSTNNYFFGKQTTNTPITPFGGFPLAPTTTPIPAPIFGGFQMKPPVPPTTTFGGFPLATPSTVTNTPASTPSLFGGFQMKPPAPPTTTTFGGFQMKPMIATNPSAPVFGGGVMKTKDVIKYEFNFGKVGMNFNLNTKTDDLKTILRHEINETQKNKFIEMTDVSVREIAKKLLDNTTYITYEDIRFRFIQTIRHHVKLLVQSSNKIKRFLVVMDVDLDANKGNEWIYDLFKNYIKVNYPEISIIPVSFNMMKTFDFIENELVVFMGDCIYDGEKISNYLLNLSRTNGYLQKPIYICLMFSYATKQGLDNIKNSFDKNKWFMQTGSGIVIYRDRTEIYPVEFYLNEKELTAIQGFYPKDYCSFYNRYAVYFDHKMEGNKLFPSGFYQGVVPNEKNKKYLNSPYSNVIIPGSNMDIVPIIDGCRNDKIEVKDAILLFKPALISSLNKNKVIKKGKKITIIKKIIKRKKVVKKKINKK